MRWMFKRASAFNQPLDSWKTSGVDSTDMFLSSGQSDGNKAHWG